MLVLRSTATRLRQAPLILAGTLCLLLAHETSSWAQAFDATPGDALAAPDAEPPVDATAALEAGRTADAITTVDAPAPADPLDAALIPSADARAAGEPDAAEGVHDAGATGGPRDGGPRDGSSTPIPIDAGPLNLLRDDGCAAAGRPSRRAADVVLVLLAMASARLLGRRRSRRSNV